MEYADGYMDRLTTEEMNSIDSVPDFGEVGYLFIKLFYARDTTNHLMPLWFNFWVMRGLRLNGIIHMRNRDSYKVVTKADVSNKLLP